MRRIRRPFGVRRPKCQRCSTLAEIERTRSLNSMKCPHCGRQIELVAVPRSKRAKIALRKKELRWLLAPVGLTRLERRETEADLAQARFMDKAV